MERWRGYALSQITPDYAWAERDTAPAPTVLDRTGIGHARASLALGRDSGYRLDIDVRASAAGSAMHRLDGGDAASALLRQHTSPLSGSLAETGLSGRFGHAGRYGLSVVLAHQRFASPILDGFSFASTVPHSGAQALSQTSHGAGVEVSVSDRLLPRLGWYAGARSRISMDAFQNYRGIYGNPGDMDLPSTLRAGLQWLPTSRTRVRFGVDRIEYSQIEPFVSSALPRRLLAVLGDGTSPVFSWRDLDIYSISLQHDLDAASQFNLRYSSRQQPLPTSPLLSRLLMEQAASYAVGLGYERDARLGHWRIAANYAPAEFVLGIPTSAKVNRPFDGRQFEFEALWTVPF
ncbi:MAG TPA: hypothetical protein VFN09_01630 [Rhodanobacteraceae bacterium]|nr:hypothetical protein [Rhodanobacteraceae bacterium]